MRKVKGRTDVKPDDEWYTPYDTARQVADWLAAHVPLDTPILCPADILPDGSEATIPQAARDAGFRSVRVTRDLPVDTFLPNWNKGELIFTNPPFSLLVPFRNFAAALGAKFCILSRPATMRNCWPIPALADRFISTEGKGVAAAWMQNIVDTSQPDPSEAIGNCLNCERKACPNNSMTGHLSPREDRPLYGWDTAVKNGTAGWHCREYTVNGKIHFARFLGEYK